MKHCWVLHSYLWIVEISPVRQSPAWSNVLTPAVNSMAKLLTQPNSCHYKAYQYCICWDYLAFGYAVSRMSQPGQNSRDMDLMCGSEDHSVMVLGGLCIGSPSQLTHYVRNPGPDRISGSSVGRVNWCRKCQGFEQFEQFLLNSVSIKLKTKVWCLITVRECPGDIYLEFFHDCDWVKQYMIREI